MNVMTAGCLHTQTKKTLGGDAFEATVRWVHDTVLARNVNVLVWLGDTIESVQGQDLLANLRAKWAIDTLKSLAVKHGVHVYMLIGNHDVYSDLYSALDIFDPPPSSAFYFVKKPMAVDYGSFRIALLPFEPWMDNPMNWGQHKFQDWVQTDDKPTALYTHVPIEGMMLGGSKDKGLDLVDVTMLFNIVFAGHYHIANNAEYDIGPVMTPIHVPGCVMAHNFKDLGRFHGACLWQTDPAPTGSVTYLQNPYSHTFFSGTKDQLDIEIARCPFIGEQLHVNLTEDVDPAPYQQAGIKTVRVRPKKESVVVAKKAVFDLGGDPVADVERLLSERGQCSPKLLELARKFLA